MATSVLPVDYSQPLTPADYVCNQCGATGCKLWREWQCVSPQLLCADCACKDQKKENTLDERGLRQDRTGETDQIGWYVPAVPMEDNHGYWGYALVPDAGVDWWTRLPLKRSAAA